MLRNEINYLIKQKINEGKSPKEIGEEVSHLLISQEGFKHLKKENKQIDRRLEKASKKIDLLREQIKKRDKQMFDLKHQITISKVEKTTRGNCVKTANVHQLKRIELLLEDSKEPMNAYHIYKACGMRKEQCVSGLNYLVHHKLIQVEKGEYFKWV